MSSQAGKAKGKALVVSTDVLVHDPGSIDNMRKDGNIVFIPWGVVLELGRIRDSPDIGRDAQEAILRIKAIRDSKDLSLRIVQRPIFDGLPVLDKQSANHQVIAAAKNLQKEGSFARVEIVSLAPVVQILAGELDIIAKPYFSNQVMVREYLMKEIKVPATCIHQDSFMYQEEFGKIGENEGVVCNSNRNPSGTWCKSFAAIRKGDIFRIIPSDISAAGIKPYSLNGNGYNWYQAVALAQLLDPKIELVFLEGGAGSGKTLLALASAIEQENRYWRIIITRPMVHLEDEDNMGYLPGNVDDKMAPWLRPITQNLNLLKAVNGTSRGDESGAADKSTAVNIKKKGKKNPKNIKGKAGEKGREDIDKYNKIEFVPLDYIRGTTFHRTLLIVDEAQNLTPHQVKTIITRAGERTKIILTGDLGQIDRRKMLNQRSNGLAYAIAKMGGPPSVGVTTFKETVRSSLASLAEGRM
jgi:PhoH-like ATPase